MNEYTPDTWVIIEIKHQDKAIQDFRVLAGWYGGFTGSDIWKINSGIVKVTDMLDHFLFAGDSGSEYKCYKTSERLSGYTAQIFSHYSREMLEAGGSLVQVPVEAFLEKFKS